MSIEQRPKIVDKRSRIADWEGDTVIGCGHQGVLVTLVERKITLHPGSPVGQVDAAVYALNHRPRKCLGWRTPHEMFYGLETTPLRLESRALRT